jgi:hypothetical protein
MKKIFIGLLMLASTLALFDNDSPVFKLTESNFKKSVLESDEFWFVEFYGNQSNNYSPMVWTL